MCSSHPSGFLLGGWIPHLLLARTQTHTQKCARCQRWPDVFLSPSTLSVQFSSASGACVGGHRTGGQGALHLCLGFLHCADCVHPQGRAHTRHRLPGLRPRGTGTIQTPLYKFLKTKKNYCFRTVHRSCGHLAASQFLDDTSVNIPAVLAGHLHPDMLCLGGYKGKMKQMQCFY